MYYIMQNEIENKQTWQTSKSFTDKGFLINRNWNAFVDRFFEPAPNERFAF